MNSYFIKTWGCQMNEHDSEKISGILAGLGYRPSRTLDDASLVLLNTCSVREKSFQKVFDFLGRLKKLKEDNPGLIIGVCGCVAQQEGERIFEKAPFVSFLMGPRNFGGLAALIERSSRQARSSDLEWRDDFVSVPYENFIRTSFPKAYITIMEGCNRRCSYCIVPQTRGREVCRPFTDIIREADHLCSEKGFHEIELLGQNVNGYRYGDKDFVDLLTAIAALSSSKRIKFTTSHPSHLSERLMFFMRDSEKICNHIHLPVQSGSTRILKFMNRGYTREEFIDKAFWLKQYIKDFTLSTDIIVGFPGEEDSDYLDTISLLKEVQFQNIYSFAYSPRPGTSAASVDDNIPRKVKMERLHDLQILQARIQEDNNKKWIGRTVSVMVDGTSRKNGNMLSGRTRNNQTVNFYGNGMITSGGNDRLVPVKIMGASIHSLIGEIIPGKESAPC